jgi:hypothetical protein
VSSKKQDLALVGAGAAACAVCCAGPILGFLAAIGLATVLGVIVFGTIGIVIAGCAIIVLVQRRRRRTTAGAPAVEQPVELIRRN